MDALSRTPSVPPADHFIWNSESVQLLVLGPGGELLRWNGAAGDGLGSRVELREGRPVWELMSENSVQLLRECMLQARGGPTRCLLTFSDAASFKFTLSCALHWADGACYLFGEQRVERAMAMNEELTELTGELATMHRERAKLAAELEHALHELRTSHWHIRRIQELLPICSVCLKVRDEEQWSSLVDFLAGNGLFMTHGYCPECFTVAMDAMDAVPGIAPAVPSAER